METTLRTYGDLVYRVALSHTATREDAEDATQEVFLAYAKQKPPFHDENHAKAWFLRVALRICAKQRMSAKRRATVELFDNLPAQNRADNDVWLAFLSLGQNYKTPAYLFYYEGLSVREIAGILGLGEAAVKKRLERARTLLRDILGGEVCE